MDQFLTELLSHGVTEIVRIGSRSKSPKLEDYTLRKVVQEKEESLEDQKEFRQEIWETKSMHSENLGELNMLCVGLNQGKSWTVLREHLADHYPRFHAQLFGRSNSANGWKVVSYRNPEQVINDWISLRFLPQSRNAALYARTWTIEDLAGCQDLSVLSHSDRLRLKEYWEEEIENDLFDKVKSSLDYVTTSKEDVHEAYRRRELRCLEEAQVVGVTTTGLSMHAPLLRQLGAKILVCEEAAEVLEAHSLTALLPSIQHAIFIGDHQQLRPHIASHHLSMESNQGRKYGLDESLFERLLREKYGEQRRLRFPVSRLDTQRRMHPSIANIVRQTLYPQLQDHKDVKEYSTIDGMARRLFWMDHEEPEANADNSDPLSVSKSNDFEVEMACALVRHLTKQGSYKQGEIAVLTPYLGQLMKLRRKLSDMYDIDVGEKDQKELELAENLDGLSVTPGTGTSIPEPEMHKKNQILQQIRLATVDNFQVFIGFQLIQRRAGCDQRPSFACEFKLFVLIT